MEQEIKGMLLLLLTHDMLPPPIEVFHPPLALSVGVKNQRTSLTLEVEVEMRDVARWEH